MRFSRNLSPRRKCAGNWRRSSMALPSRLIFLLCPLLLGAQTPTDLSRILERLDRLEKENRELSEQVRKLTDQINGTTSSTAPPTAETPPKLTPEQRLEIVVNRVEEQAQTKVEASQKGAIRLSGMALFNAFMNSKQNGGSDYPVVAGPTGAGHSGATVRQSIIGLEFQDPTAIWGGKAHGSIYMDFFGGANNSAVRVRTATVQIDWKTRSIAAGLEKPIFNPREPSSLAQVGVSPLTGAGNLWLWIPQVRVEQDLRFTSATSVRAQLGVVQTREIGDYTSA